MKYPDDGSGPNTAQKSGNFEGVAVSDDNHAIPAQRIPPARLERATVKVEASCSNPTELRGQEVDPEYIEWLPIPSAPDYAVSNTGIVRRMTPSKSNRSRPGRVMKQTIDQCGYPRVAVGKNRQPIHVHKLVAEAFIGHRPQDMTVDHLDGNKLNNHATNLEYVTRAENVRRAHRDGKYPSGEGKPSAKLTEAQVLSIAGQLDRRSNCSLAREFGVSDVAIRKIRLGSTWSHVTGRVSVGAS